ncbi:MAG: division/cell wall cluster transcriptional repressor MraZ [Erysipelotrichaceae bacterium]|nr:division/cell wall cluster transcriptional repressor MraZ [Erysipelotrichaceae bacterium]
MLLGEYHHSLDGKGRIAVPAKLRFDLGETIIINRYMDGCLAIYSQESWNKKYEELMALNQNHADTRAYVRAMTSKAYELSYDAQGRILVPSTLIDLAKLDKNCVFIGAGDHVELWNEDAWNTYDSNTLTDEQLADIAERL